MATKRPVNKRASADERRPQILAGAAALFQKSGYHATSMDELAAALGLNKATIYHHFPGGKRDLLYGVYLDGLDALFTRSSRQPVDGTPVERLQYFVEDMMATVLERPDSVVVYYEESRWLKGVLSREQYEEIRERELTYRARLRQVIEDGVEAGDFRAADPRFVTVLIVEAVVASYRASSALPSRAPEVVVGQLWELIAHGLLVDRPAG